MASIAKIPVTDKDPAAALQAFLASLLERGVADAVFTMRQQPGSGVAMPALITDPALMSQASPLSPAFPLNGAKLLSRLTHGENTGVVAAVLRPCELRAFVELIKLNQGNSDNLLLIGLDCYGAYDNNAYRQAIQATDARTLTLDFINSGGSVSGGQEIAKACKACEYATPEGADLALGFFGADLAQYIPLISQSAAGESAVRKLELEDASDSGQRTRATQELTAQRIAFRDAMFEETSAATANMEKLGEYLSGCVNCYNCRVACPVCYCKELRSFLTDVFDHKPWQYMGWAEKIRHAAHAHGYRLFPSHQAGAHEHGLCWLRTMFQTPAPTTYRSWNCSERFPPKRNRPSITCPVAIPMKRHRFRSSRKTNSANSRKRAPKREDAMKSSYGALVVGAGVAGIHAALDLAEDRP